MNQQTLKKFTNYDCHVVINSENRGFVGGCNDGIGKAIEIGVDFVCFLNNDTLFKNDFLSPLIELLSDPSVGAVGGTIHASPSNDLWFGIGEWNPYFVRANSSVAPEGTQDTEWITGCLFASRVEILQEVGGFDERYFLYLEDVDLSRRIKQKGYRLITTDQSQIHHEVGQALNESEGPSTVRAYYMARNRVLFAKTHFNGLNEIFSLFLSSILSLLWSLKLIKDRQIGQSLAIVRGLMDGFVGVWGKKSQYP